MMKFISEYFCAFPSSSGAHTYACASRVICYIVMQLQHEILCQFKLSCLAAEAVRQSMEKEKIPENKCDDVPHTTVTNGQVCSKKWTQIYYLKVRLAMAGVTSQV